jgi:hypothetical protein
MTKPSNFINFVDALTYELIAMPDEQILEGHDPNAIQGVALATLKAGNPNFKQLGDVAETFDTSLTATALRLVGIDTLPAIVACYTQAGRRWHVAAKHVPRRWYLKDKVDEDSVAYDLHFAGKECRALGKQSADAWFTNSDAGRYEVLEQCVRTRSDEVLVLIYLADSQMLYAGFDPTAGNRKHTEPGSYLAPRVKR